jgi:preprotein translocase subunit SecG
MWNAIMAVHFVAIAVLILFTVSHVSRREGITGLGGPVSETMRGGKGLEESMKGWAKWAAYTFLVSSVLLWIFYQKKL